MPANRKVIYTQGVPIEADFNSSDGAPLIVDINTGILYGLAGGVVATITPCQQVETGIVATGTTQGTAVELTAGMNYIATVAAGTGVRVQASASGLSYTVYNAGANALKVYPPTGSKINQLAANAAMILPVNTGARFDVVSATQIVGILSA